MLTPTTARSFGQEICRSPGTSANRNVPSRRFTTSDFTMSAGVMPSRAAASSSEFARRSLDRPRPGCRARPHPRSPARARSARLIPSAHAGRHGSGRHDLGQSRRCPRSPRPRHSSIGPLRLDVPVVLAPMAGITNTAFRRLCREYGAGLYVSEMITSRALVERTPESMRLIRHHESETPRSIQLYGVDPKTVAEAVTMLVAEDRADHIDLNFGCPVPKVTRKGGGAALPWKLDLFREIVERAVKAAGDIPLTDQDAQGHRRRPPHLPRGRSRRRGRGRRLASRCTPARPPSSTPAPPTGRRSRSSRRRVTSVPGARQRRHLVGEDALRMVDETGCDGVVVGRGCLGRPWLFGDLAAAFRGETAQGRADARRGRRRVPPARRAAGRVLRRGGPRLPRHPQARRLVLQGLRGRRRAPRGARDGVEPRRDRRAARPARPRPAVPGRGRRGSARPRRHAEDPDRCPTAGSTAASCRRPTAPSSPRPSCTTAVAEFAPRAGLRARRICRALAARGALHPPQRLRPRSRPRCCTRARCAGSPQKTQVLSPTAGLDFARNRLTHSLEVAQVGRELAVQPRPRSGCRRHRLPRPRPRASAVRAQRRTRAQRLGTRDRRLRGQRADPAAADAARAQGASTTAGNPFGLNLTRASLDASCKYPWPARDGVPDPSGRSKFGFYAG